jgi:hypothetical protein
VEFPTGGKVREPVFSIENGLSRLDYGTDSKVWMEEENCFKIVHFQF